MLAFFSGYIIWGRLLIVHCLWIDFQDTQIRKTTKRKYSQHSLKQQEVQRQYIIIVCILNRGVCTEVENLGSLMSWGQGELSVIKGCLYKGGRDCTKFGIFATKRTVHNRGVCIMEVSARRGSTVSPSRYYLISCVFYPLGPTSVVNLNFLPFCFIFRITFFIQLQVFSYLFIMI